MTHFETELFAVDVKTGKLTRFAGPTVMAESVESAQSWCMENGLGYLEVMGPAPVMIISSDMAES